MDDETRKSLISAAISVGLIFVGWFLGQGTEMLRKLWSNRRLKVGLYTELQDLRSALNALRTHYIHRLEGHAVGYIETSEPVPLNNYIFSRKYSEINLKLNRNQRLSYETIHSFVDSTNKALEKISDLTTEVIETHDFEIVEKLGELLKIQYLNVDLLRWRIGYHLRNPKKPTLELNDKDIGEYVQAQKFNLEQIESLIEGWQLGTQEDYLTKKEFRYQILTMPTSTDD